MREKVRDRGRLEHILEAIESIEEFHAQYTFEDIKKNKLIFYGFTKLVEVIGEAVYMLSTEFRDSHSDVNWRQIERMRHVLVHGYYTMNYNKKTNTVYEIITGRKPGDKFMERAEYVGFAILLLLLVVANLNDVLRFFHLM